jgi:hypothetical protein
LYITRINIPYSPISFLYVYLGQGKEELPWVSDFILPFPIQLTSLYPPPVFSQSVFINVTGDNYVTAFVGNQRVVVVVTEQKGLDTNILSLKSGRWKIPATKSYKPSDSCQGLQYAVAACYTDDGEAFCC